MKCYYPKVRGFYTCDRDAHRQCQTCGVFACDTHSRMADGKFICIRCATIWEAQYYDEYMGVNVVIDGEEKRLTAKLPVLWRDSPRYWQNRQEYLMDFIRAANNVDFDSEKDAHGGHTFQVKKR